MDGWAGAIQVCKKVGESGGVEAIMQLVRGAGAETTAVARPACALLRQLAGSDALKPHIIAADGLVCASPCPRGSVRR